MEHLFEKGSGGWGSNEGVGMGFWKESVFQAERIARANCGDQTEGGPYGELQIVKDGQCVDFEIGGEGSTLIH